ncbi:MAG: substrate-binding domain-containing protein [Rudaea sp.]|uniref:substrate-binding domain-containing protein n=1 Tax=unclassified Rudaea TaxID=2627037 RepID=UPI0010F7719F|nr:MULTISPECIES: substrate-binding domain-containing protein [unclassified Rudaea]MBN8885553.1 substrate-binding domain-containing protein [Rudaea sp.]
MKNAHKYTFTVLACALGVALGFGIASPAAAQAPAAAKPAAKPAAKKAAPVAAKAKAPPGIIWRGDRATERGFVADLAKQYELSRLGKVTMQPFSTISGIDAVNDGTADVAGSARPAMPGRAEETNLTFYPVAWEAMVPITSPKNPTDSVTLKQLYDIYLGQVKNWKDLGGPDSEINLYAIAAPLDGVDYVLRKYIYNKGDQAIAAPRVYMNTMKLEEGVTIDPRGLGFTTLSSVYGNPKIKVLKVEGVPATSATIKDGSYPLYAPLYLALRKDSKNFEAAEKFVNYASSDAGKAIIRKHQLVPIDDAPALTAELDKNSVWVAERAQGKGEARPVSAPVATADYLIRTQPNSVEAQEAKQRAAEALAQKKAAASKP